MCVHIPIDNWADAKALIPAKAPEIVRRGLEARLLEPKQAAAALTTLLADESAAEFSERTARLVRLAYASESDAALAEPGLGGPEVEEVRRDGPRVTALLVSADPRRFLGLLAAREDLPAPTSIEHGRPSLVELYRDLYGVEGT